MEVIEDDDDEENEDAMNSIDIKLYRSAIIIVIITIITSDIY